MKYYLSSVQKRYQETFQSAETIRSLILAVLLFGVSLYVNYLSGIYATARVSNSVTDLILSNTPKIDSKIIQLIFIEGAIILWIFILTILFHRPKEIPFILKTAALFIIIRAIFVSLTHLAPFPLQTQITANIFVDRFTFGGDLFFSGHTGLPFLFALVYWRERLLSQFFLLASIIFALTVLLGHLHYSIDVFGAYFITYSIFSLSCWLFRRDRARFLAR